MLHLNLLGVDVFIKKANSAKLNPYWENYDLIIWKKNNNGYTNQRGMFRKNSWGVADRVSVENNGIWKLPTQYVKYFK
jgi:hypothetical protein